MAQELHGESGEASGARGRRRRRRPADLSVSGDWVRDVLHGDIQITDWALMAACAFTCATAPLLGMRDLRFATTAREMTGVQLTNLIGFSHDTTLRAIRGERWISLEELRLAEADSQVGPHLRAHLRVYEKGNRAPIVAGNSPPDQTRSCPTVNREVSVPSEAEHRFEATDVITTATVASRLDSFLALIDELENLAHRSGADSHDRLQEVDWAQVRSLAQSAKPFAEVVREIMSDGQVWTSTEVRAAMFERGYDLDTTQIGRAMHRLLKRGELARSPKNSRARYVVKPHHGNHPSIVRMGRRHPPELPAKT